MKTETIFKKLSAYLTVEQYTRLRLYYSCGGILIVCRVNDIIHEYNSTDEDEQEVMKLLYFLCRNYFKKQY